MSRNSERHILPEHTTWGQALVWGVERLRASAIGYTPDLDAQTLLTHMLGVSRATLLAYPERKLTYEQAAAFANFVERRLAHEPVAYLVGHREFMGLDFAVDRRALIPRPETELLVEAALVDLRARLGNHAQTASVADIGTGSGAIALSLARLEPRAAPIYALDISTDALDLARENARRLGVAERVTFLQSDLLDALPQPVDMLLANLPYVARHDQAELAIDVRRYEPELALYGDEDGLALLRRFFAQAPKHVNLGATIGVEFGYNQRNTVEALARSAFPNGRIRVGADYAGWDRFALIHLGG
ncbi:MAG TPA: peptide chain release factor N(5)-glutamine methyltransferase [Ktedonobacterales bacterium]|jgi:release factor glutamine methyltransferase